MGGIMGGAQFKLTIRNIEKSGLTFENGKVEGKIPLDKYLKYRKMSVNNPDSDTMTLGKYEPTIRPDGTPDYSIPGPGAYTQKAGDTTYFILALNGIILQIHIILILLEKICLNFSINRLWMML